MERWIDLVLVIPKTYVNHRQTVKQTEIINRTKLVISFNWGKIDVLACEEKSLIFAVPFI